MRGPKLRYRKAQAPQTERAQKGWGKWVWNLLIAFDQLGNAVIAGDPDETISSRAGKALKKKRRWARTLCWGLDWIDPGHCKNSVDPSEGEDQVWED